MFGVRNNRTPPLLSARKMASTTQSKECWGIVLNHVRHVDEVILFRPLTEKVADIALDFVQIDAARHRQAGQAGVGPRRAPPDAGIISLPHGAGLRH
jgi:hypothetical protein